MTPSTRDRISVDLHGLKGALFECARALGVSPSALVRTTLAEALGHAEGIKVDRAELPQLRGRGDRVRLCLRMSHEHAHTTVVASRRVGLSPGDYVGGLVANVPVLSAGGSRTEYIATLVASNAELSTLSRNIHRLAALLHQANVEPARQYREMLDALADEVRSHLELAARVLADLQPRRRSADTSARANA